MSALCFIPFWGRGQFSSYRPYGHLVAGEVDADKVAWVEVDGVKYTNVTELHDVEGWVRVIAPPKNSYEPVRRRIEGEVRIIWQRESLYGH